MKSLQAAVDYTPKKKRSTLEVTTSRNKQLEWSCSAREAKSHTNEKMLGANQAQKMSFIAWPLNRPFVPWRQSYP